MPRSTSLVSLNLAHFFCHLILLIFPTAALAMAHDWEGGYPAVLALGTWTFAVFALATLPVGWLGDRCSRSLLMRVFWLGSGGACIATALAQGPWSLAAGLGAIGLFAAIYHPVATAMVYAGSRNAGTSLAVNGVYGNMGVAAAALLTGVLTQAFGWRWAFAAPGAVMLALGSTFRRGDPPQADGPRAATHVEDPAQQGRVFLVLAALALLGGLIFNGTTIVLPKLLEERLTVGVAAVGGIGAAIFALAAFAQLPVGRLLDRVGPRRLILVIEALKTLLLILLAVIPGAAGVALTLPLMLLVFGEIPITAWLLGRWVVPAWRSRAYGLQFLLSLGVGSATVPLIAALHARTGDAGALMLVLAVSSVLVWSAAMLLPTPRRGGAGTVAA